MAQKDKVKALVGGGLNAYHTRVNNQIERIEKENVRQNHMINVLNTELVKDYLTKTEEGSVISLDHSKDGMVFVDGLEGNTLVNYATDGSKEMILNGDIDTEGTFVTTTEGVDGGMVDVLCEGNTMVNLCVEGSKVVADTTYKAEYLLNAIKNKTTYTVCFEIFDLNNIDNIAEIHTSIENSANSGLCSVKLTNGFHKALITTRGIDDSIPLDTTLPIKFNAWILNKTTPKQTVYSIRNIIVLEGDWSNKEIPNEYFEGMKSVGEGLDKFEILSQNKNYYTNVKLGKYYLSDGVLSNESDSSYSEDYISVKQGQKFIANHLSSSIQILEYDANKKLIQRLNHIPKATYIVPTNVAYIRLSFYRLNTILENKFQFELGETVTTYVEGKLNKKEILLNEPLRGLPNGVKDRFVKIGGKWFIERNCMAVELTPNMVWSNWGIKDTDYYGVFQYIVGAKRTVNEGATLNAIATTRPSVESLETIRQSKGIGVKAGSHSTDYGYIALGFKKSELTEVNSIGVSKWIESNPTTVIIQRQEVVYEPIIDSELICYLDTTHISNNSTIPCNMKVKNSGYNTIIKPSTQYTIICDTNKNVTLGYQLGGGRVNTTNNVALLNTPATLTDDSLRVYGKGAKGKNVRLLEGNKTNWIPSMFEGMKSCFEDKSNVVELKSVGKNLSTISNYTNTFTIGVITNSQNGSVVVRDIRVKPNTRYYISCGELKSGLSHYQIITSSKPINASNHLDAYQKRIREIPTMNTPILTGYNEHYITITTGNWNPTEENKTFIVRELMIEESDMKNQYVEHLSNKIQFLLKEPLRKWDRFVFIDGKVMVERGSGVRVLKETDTDLQFSYDFTDGIRFRTNTDIYKPYGLTVSSKFFNGTTGNGVVYNMMIGGSGNIEFILPKNQLSSYDTSGMKQWLQANPTTVIYQLAEPTYEEIPTELADIILECYENGTLFIDTIIPPTVSVRYSGETPMATKLKKSNDFVGMNTYDINENIIPYLLDMDYRVVLLQLQSGQSISQYKSLGNIKDMLTRDIQSQRYSKEHYFERIGNYFLASKITKEEFIELGEMLND